MGKPKEKYLARSHIRNTRPERRARKPVRPVKLIPPKYAVTVERPILLSSDSQNTYEQQIDNVAGGVSRKLPRRLRTKQFKTYSCFSITDPENLVLTQIQTAVLSEQSAHMPLKTRRALMERIAIKLQEELYLNIVNSDAPAELPVTFSHLQVAPYQMPMTLHERSPKFTVTSTPDGWRGVRANYLSDDPGLRTLALLATENKIAKQAIDSECIYLDKDTAVTDPLAIVIERGGEERGDELRRMQIGMEKANVLPLRGVLLDPVVKLYEHVGPKVHELDEWPVLELVGCNPLALPELVELPEAMPLALAA